MALMEKKQCETPQNQSRIPFPDTVTSHNSRRQSEQSPNPAVND